MSKVAFTLMLVAQSVLAADHHAAPQDEKVEVTIAASGSLNVRAAAAADSVMMRREDEAPQNRQTVFDTPLRSEPIAAHKQEELLQVQSTAETTPRPLVSCGGHQASTCSLCTVRDPKDGSPWGDRGADWCHGDCTYFEGACHTLTEDNKNIQRQAGFANVSTTKHIPDLLNPEITPDDKKIMDIAADKSVAEAEYEAKQRLSNEQERRKEKNGKFIVTVIVSTSVVLFFCAVASLIALWQYIKKGDGSNGMTKLEEPLIDENAESSGEDSPVEDGEEATAGQGEGEAAGEW